VEALASVWKKIPRAEHPKYLEAKDARKTVLTPAVDPFVADMENKEELL